MTAPPSRKIPRGFKLHWANGVIAEEASVQGPYHEPCIQLLEFEDGSMAVRFCYYSLEGRFQRSPLILSEEDVEQLRDEIKANPKLLQLLKKLVQ